MASAMLLRLQHELDSRRPKGITNPVCLVTNDGEDVGGGDDLGSCSHHMLQQRLAGNPMQHFGVA
jgi:hypothetical protein